MISRLKPTLGPGEILAALSFPRRDDVERFERRFAAFMGQAHAVAFPYGRTGLMTLLKAMGLTRREIVCPAYTCVVVPHAIIYSGNLPVFADCAAKGFNMDLDKADALIGPATGAIIPTSIFGEPVDLDRLDAIRKRHPDLPVIHDCAHGFHAEWNGRPVQKAGDAAVFGLNISKIMNSVFGGMVTTDNPLVHAKLAAERDRILQPASRRKGLRRLFYLAAVYPTFQETVYGMVNRLEHSGLLNAFVNYYAEDRIDMPDDYLEAMTGLEARVGCVQLERLDTMIAERRRYAAYYRKVLRDVKGIRFPDPPDGCTYSHVAALAENRDALVEQARTRGVQLGILIEYCIPDMTAYLSYRTAGTDYPNARYYAGHTVNLPLCGEFRIERAKKTVEVLQRLLPKQNRDK